MRKNKSRPIKVAGSGELSLADKILALILGVIVVIMFAQVFSRYILNSSLSWSEEIVGLLFIWLTFLGASLNIRDKWHIGVDFVPSVLPPYWARKLLIFNMVVVFLFLVFLVIGGFIWVIYSKGAYSSALGLPLHLVLYGALPTTSILGCYYIIQRIKKNNYDSKNGTNV